MAPSLALTLVCLFLCARHIDACDDSDDSDVLHCVARPRSAEDAEILLRNGVNDSSYLWPGGVVPYKMEKFSCSEKRVVRRAMKVFESKTCIRFVEHSFEEDYVVFKKNCHTDYAQVGRKGGRQVVNLRYSNVKHGSVLHHIMHTLGFWHEQSRVDRDCYVHIVYDNINEKKYSSFEIHDGELFNLPYDFASVLHSGAYEFSVNEAEPSIIPLCGFIGSDQMGKWPSLSDLDVIKINKMYKCHKDEF